MSRLDHFTRDILGGVRGGTPELTDEQVSQVRDAHKSIGKARRLLSKIRKAQTDLKASGLDESYALFLLPEMLETTKATHACLYDARDVLDEHVGELANPLSAGHYLKVYKTTGWLIRRYERTGEHLLDWMRAKETKAA